MQSGAEAVAAPLTAARAASSTRRPDGGADGHREGVVVERAAMGQPAARRVEGRHQVGAAAEGAERQPAGEVLAERRHVGRHAEQRLGAADGQPRRHHLVEDEHRAGSVVTSAERGEEVRVAGDAAAGAEHRLDEDAGDVGAVGGELGLGRGDVVVRQHGVVERDPQRRAAMAEVERPAVVAVVEDDDAAAAGGMARRHQRHHVGLGAGVGEAHLLDRREARDHGLGEQRSPARSSRRTTSRGRARRG